MKLFKPFSPEQASNHFNRYFEKINAEGKSKPLQVRIFSPKLRLDYSFPSDSTNQPFHTASIGKLFTATLVQMLAERGDLSISDHITHYLSSAELERLFVYQNIDYAPQVTIEHLLAHTSGIADYFEGKTINGQSFIHDIISNPQFHWTPQKLLDYSRENQIALGIPGKVFNYSDTSYILLGLIIEKISGNSFAENLKNEIFHPLKMDDSYLMFYTQPVNMPKKELEKIWFDGTEISRYESLSCDWAGGGIVSTTADLLKFNQALRSGSLLQNNSLQIMDNCLNKFRPGIYYGLGMMEIHFAGFFFLLGRLPRIKGHIGILSTHLFYDPTNEAHIILNFGSNKKMVVSFKALIEIENSFQRIRY